MLFQHLLPLEIATAVRKFRKSTATELCNVQAIATEADTNCASSLKAMGLPASLETEQEGSEQGISDATWSRYAACMIHIVRPLNVHLFTIHLKKTVSATQWNMNLLHLNP